MYLIESTPAEDFQNLAKAAGLNDEELTLQQKGLRAVPVAHQELLRPEFKALMKAYTTNINKRRRIELQAKSQGKTLRIQTQLGLVHLKETLPAKGQVYVAIVIPPPPEAPTDRAAVTDSAPSGEVQNTGDLGPYEVVIRKSAGEDREVALRIGDIVQLDEDERMVATGDGIALMIFSYEVVQENHDQ